MGRAPAHKVDDFRSEAILVHVRHVTVSRCALSRSCVAAMGGSWIAPSALLVVRRGAELVYFHDRDLAREYLFRHPDTRQLCPEPLDVDTTQGMNRMLIHFEGEFLEVVNASLKYDNSPPGAASATI